MPIYRFECDNCHSGFEISRLMHDLEKHPKCPTCNSLETYQDFSSIYVCDGSPSTVGGLAERNTARMSEDEKHHINEKNNAYKKQPFTGKLPEGAYQLPVDSKGNKVASTRKGRDFSNDKRSN